MLENIKLSTLANKPFTVGKINIYPVTLGEIVDVTYPEYQKYLSVYSIKKRDLINLEVIEIPNEIEAYEIIMSLYDNNELYHYLVKSLSLFTKAKKITYQNRVLYLDDIEVPRDVFKKIIEVIKIQNAIYDEKEIDYNPKNERVKKLKERMLEAQRKIDKLKKDSLNGQEELDFSDLVSIVASRCNGISILNVFDLNIYQFNNLLLRAKIIDDYDIGIQSLLHGANPKETKLKHWISKA